MVHLIETGEEDLMVGIETFERFRGLQVRREMLKG